MLTFANLLKRFGVPTTDFFEHLTATRPKLFRFAPPGLGLG